MTLVVGGQDQLLGIITDGDLRRLIEKQKDISQACAKDMMGGKPKTITRDTLAAKAVRINPNSPSWAKPSVNNQRSRSPMLKTLLII
jgi:arabinose-5-phosphate isomerase